MRRTWGQVLVVAIRLSTLLCLFVLCRLLPRNATKAVSTLHASPDKQPIESMPRIAHRLFAVVIVFVGVLAPWLNVFAVTTSYHIGNSLTYDSQPLGIESLAASRGLDHQVGFHIRSSASLQSILANPTDVTTTPNEFGTFDQALPNNNWDIVTLQPHNDNAPITTLAVDTESILSFINLTRSNPANAETNFYIYQTWPQKSAATYQTLWNTPSLDQPGTHMSRTRAYYNNLIEHVRSETDANVYIVPVGEVLYELDIKMRAGQIPGFTSVGQLYRDALHMSYGPGRFVAGVTTFATILGQYPNELEIPDDFYGGPSSLSPVQKAIFLETIRDVLDKHPYTGLIMPAPLRADFDGNLTVDESDLDFWEASEGITGPYDTDQDGDVDGRDFLFWQRNYQTQLPPAQLAIADLNNDGVYNHEDLPVWQNSYGLNNGGDVDGDGDTDGRDFLFWQRTATMNPADLNGDYVVDSLDLAEWRQTYAYVVEADANFDGVIDMADYDIWAAENGLSWTFPQAFMAPPLASQIGDIQAGVVVVPEPGTAILALLVLLLLNQRVLHRGQYTAGIRPPKNI